MSKVKEMLEELEKELRQNKQYSAADKLLPIIEEAGKNDWIPYSERLPEEKGWYSCSCYDEDVWGKDGMVRDLYWYPEIQQFVDNIRYAEHLNAKIENYFWTKYVTAWQPLPEPFKGE